MKVDGRVTRAASMRKIRRAEICDAAAGVFAARGFHDGSVAEIIERAGVSRGTFYLYFDGKRAVFDAIIEDVLDQIASTLIPVDIRSSVPPFEQLVANVQRVFGLLSQRRDHTRILFQHAEGIDDEFDARLQAFYEGVLDLIGGSLDTGRELGIIRHLDHEIVAVGLLGAVKEATTRILLNRPHDEAEHRRMAESLLEYHLRGLLAG